MGRAEDLFSRLQAGGEATIDELIADRQSEELFLDFKRSSDDGDGPRLTQIDRVNLALADTNRFNPVPKQRVPTLALHGAVDPVNSPQMSEGKETYFTGPYERRLIDGAGHFPQRNACSIWRRRSSSG